MLSVLSTLSSVHLDHQTATRDRIGGWPFSFGIGRVLLFFFRSSVWFLLLPRYTPPPAGELSSLLCFLLYSLVFLSSCFFFLIWYIIIYCFIPLVACGVGGFSESRTYIPGPDTYLPQPPIALIL